jgi:hypothetical protein
MADLIPYLPYLGGVLAMVCLACAFQAGRQRRIIDNLPVSKTTGVFMGLVELKGRAASSAPLSSYLANMPCVYYQWTVEEHWTRQVLENFTDNQGRTQRRSREESGWMQVAEGAEHIFNKTCGTSDPFYFAKGPASEVVSSDHQRRFVEQAIMLHQKIYVVGQAREREDMVAPQIAADKNAPLFLISTRPQEKVSAGMTWGSHGWVLLGLLAVVGPILWHDIALRLAPGTRIWIYAAMVGGYLSLGLCCGYG